MIAETGIAGITLYIFLIAYIFIENVRTRANARKIDNKFILFVAHGLDGGLIAFLVSTIFFSVTWYPMFWVQFSLTVALNGIAKKSALEYDAALVRK